MTSVILTDKESSKVAGWLLLGRHPAALYAPQHLSVLPSFHFQPMARSVMWPSLPLWDLEDRRRHWDIQWQQNPRNRSNFTTTKWDFVQNTQISTFPSFFLDGFLEAIFYFSFSKTFFSLLLLFNLAFLLN